MIEGLLSPFKPKNPEAKTLMVYGVSSVIGRKTALAAAEAGYKVFGTYNTSLAPEVVKMYKKGQIKGLYKADLTRDEDAEIIANEVRPDVAIMLSAHAKNNPALGDAVYHQNQRMVFNVAESLQGVPGAGNNEEAVLLLASTILVNGAQDGNSVIGETPLDDLPEPSEQDSYVRSKIWGEGHMHYRRAFGYGTPLDVRIVRIGNTIGSGQEAGLLVTDLIAQVPAIQAGEKEGFEPRKKNAGLDLSDSEDIGRALIAIIQNGKSGQTYNAVSGRQITAEQLAFEIGRSFGLGDVSVRSTVNDDPSFARFSNEKLKTLGWEPKYSFEQTVSRFCDWVRNLDTQADIRFQSYIGLKGLDPYLNLRVRPLLDRLGGWEKDEVLATLEKTGELDRQWVRERYRG